MNAIREIRKVENGKVEIDLPKNFNGKDVEVIVLLDLKRSLTNQSKDKKNKKGRSLAGIFHKYAKPELIPFEKDIAWTKVAKEKYDSR